MTGCTGVPTGTLCVLEVFVMPLLRSASPGVQVLRQPYFTGLSVWVSTHLGSRVPPLPLVEGSGAPKEAHTVFIAPVFLPPVCWNTCMWCLGVQNFANEIRIHLNVTIFWVFRPGPEENFSNKIEPQSRGTRARFVSESTSNN